MKVSEGLFSLIKSLSKTEKRYIRLVFRGKKGPTNYERLFNAIDKQETYDEPAIKEKFTGESFIRQLTTAKHYLKNFILKELRNYQTHKSVSVLLKEGLHNVEILFNRGLLSYADQEIKRLEKKAAAFEAHTSQIEILTWKRKVFQALHPEQIGQIKSMIREQQALVKRMENHFDYWDALTNLNKPQEMLAFLEEKKAESLEAEVLRWHLLYRATIMNNDEDASARNFEEAMTYLDSHPARIEEAPNLYIGLGNNYLASLLFVRDYEKADQLISSLKSFIHNHPLAETQPLIKSLLRIFNLEMEIYRDTEAIEKAHQLREEILSYTEPRLNQVPKSYSHSFWFQFAHIYFLCGENSEALHFINKILNEKESAVRSDIQMYARWLNIIIHYEMDNVFVLRYFVDNTRRFLKKRKKIEPYEQELLKLFTKLGQAPKFDHKSIFSAIQAKSQQAETPFFPANALNYVNFENWIETHAK